MKNINRVGNVLLLLVIVCLIVFLLTLRTAKADNVDPRQSTLVLSGRVTQIYDITLPDGTPYEYFQIDSKERGLVTVETSNVTGYETSEGQDGAKISDVVILNVSIVVYASEIGDPTALNGISYTDVNANKIVASSECSN